MTLICHGDSLTQGNDIAPFHTWPALLGNILGVAVHNKGISGDTTGGMLSRFTGDVLAHDPSIVILMGGSNDLWYDLGINLILANLSAMVNQAVYHGIAPVIGLPLPISTAQVSGQGWMPPAGGYDLLSRRIHDLTDRLAAAAEGWEVPVLDFHRLFLDDQGSVRSSLLLPDGVHAAKRGHQQMAAHAAHILRQECLFPGLDRFHA